MTYFLDEFKEYDYNESGIPTGSIIGIYGKFYKLSIWYVYSYYNKNVTIIKLDDNHKLLENPVMLMLSTDELDYFIIDWDANYINISSDYISNFYQFTQPLFKIRYGDIINLSDYKDKYTLFFVMNFDPVTNTYMILSMSKTKKKQYYSINIGLCNYYILSRKELRSNIISKSMEFTKKYIIDCYETLDLIDENIYIKNKMNFLLQNSYNVNPYTISSGFLHGSLNTIKADLEEYDNHIYDHQLEIVNDNDEWKKIFSKKKDETANDENYINNISIETKENQDNQINSINCPIIKIYHPLDDCEINNDELEKYLYTPEKEKNFIEFSYSSEEYDYNNKFKYTNTIQHYKNYNENDNDNYNENTSFKEYLECYKYTDDESANNDQIENNFYSENDDCDSNSDTNEEISYCSDRYMYNNKYNADYTYEQCDQSSSQYQVNSNNYENSEFSEDNLYKPKYNIQSSLNKIQYDYDYINTLFENYYNLNNSNKLTILDSVKLDCDNNDFYSEMPKLIPITELINNNFVNSEIVIEIAYSTEQKDDTIEKKININDEIQDILKPEPINEILNNAPEIDLLHEEYVDIDINDVEPYSKNNESCSMM